ncbi:MAG: arginase family protein [Candidatus Hodarchaeales archaeon]|jgi:arginase
MKKLILSNINFLDEDPLAALIEAGLLEKLNQEGIPFKIKENINIEQIDATRDPNTEILDINGWKTLSFRIIEQLKNTDFDKEFHLIIGGDCSNLLGIMGHFKSKNEKVGLIALDAHTDYRLPEDSPTGEPADIEMAIITGTGPNEITSLFGSKPIIQEENVFLFGIRELDNICDSNIPYLTYKDMNYSLNNVIKRLNHFKMKKLPVWLHLDVDVLDPKHMPVNFPVPNGMTYSEVLDIIILIKNNIEVLGFSIGCYHPDLDKNQKATENLVELISDFIKAL